MKRSPAPIRSRAESTKSTASTSSKAASTVCLHPLGERVERPLEARAGRRGRAGGRRRSRSRRCAAGSSAACRRRSRPCRRRARSRASTCRRSGGPRRPRSRTSSPWEVPGVGQKLARAVLGDRAVVAAEGDALDPPLVQPLAAAAAGRGRDPIASTSPGRTPSLAAFAIAVRSAQTPERIGRVLDVDAVEDAPVARDDGSRRRVPEYGAYAFAAAASARATSSSAGHASAPPPYEEVAVRGRAQVEPKPSGATRGRQLRPAPSAA